LSVLAKLPLRSKLILVVSIPLFVILGFAGVGIANRLSDLDGQRQYSRLRFPNDALAGLQSTLENEGVLTTWYTAAPTRDPVVAAKLDRARDATDRAAAGARAAGADLGSDVSASTKRAWDALDVRLDTLKSLRRQADDHAGLPEAFGERYGTLVDDTLDVSERMARDVSDRQLSDSMLGIVDLRAEQAASAQDAMIVMPYLVTGSSTQFNDWIAALAAQDNATAKFLASATPSEREAFTELRAAPSPDDPFHASAGSVPDAFPKVEITPAAYYESWREKQTYLGNAIDAVQRVVDNMAASLESDALSAVLAYGLGVSALVLIVLVLAWIMIRSVNRSLHSLTEAARDVADVQLPNLVNTLQRGGDPSRTEIHPLTVSSNDEIGELARVFNTIQETTVRVAEEQAGLLRKGIGDLYVNLARRNQSLVDRQISLLDVLEAHAQDPEQLSSLFELDHLATRMRRNAESLLVLSGAGQSRQWSEAIPILDVVRAASGEIADFARVSFVGFEGDVAIAGNAVADVTHILAELLENATSFSPPGSPVIVAGMLAERRFVVSITDEGIGMDEARLAGANALLQAPPPPGLSLSRTLGLHVVAHLARRYSIRVQLRRAQTGGVTAILALPATVLARVAGPEPTPPAAPPQPPIATAPEPMVFGDPVVPSEPQPMVFTEPEPVFLSESDPEPEPVTASEPVSDSPPPQLMGWDAGAAPPPAGPPIAPQQVEESEPPVAEAPVFEVPVFEAVEPEVLGAAEPETFQPETFQPETFQPETFQPETFQPEPNPAMRFEPVGYEDPELSVFDPNEFEVPFEPLVGAGEYPDPIVLDPPLDPASTQAFAAAAWPEPEVVPPAFDPSAPAPPAATPAEPLSAAGLGQALFDGGDEDLPRRIPGASPLGVDGETSTLPTRSPGRHLSHQPVPAAAGTERDARPRPERVHDLLTRHLRGIRDGRSDDLTTRVPADHADSEASP
jgi:methyl-accepting chemotaxis protein